MVRLFELPQHCNPVGSPIVARTTPDGPFVTRQAFTEGSVYELTATRGTPKALMDQAMALVPDNWALLSTHCPWDLGEDDDPNLYISMWVPR